MNSAPRKEFCKVICRNAAKFPNRFVTKCDNNGHKKCIGWLHLIQFSPKREEDITQMVIHEKAIATHSDTDFFCTFASNKKIC